MTSTTAPSGNRERGSAMTALVAVLGALVISAIVILAFYYFDTPPPASYGRVLSLNVFPVSNTSSTGIISGGISGQPQTFNEVIVLANVEVRNSSKAPIHLFDLDSYLYIPNSDIYENGAADHDDFERAFIAYPQLVSKEGKPLRRGTVLAPGQVVIGQLLFHFPLTQAQWQSRKKFHIVISWQDQDNLILNLKGAATSTGWQHP